MAMITPAHLPAILVVDDESIFHQMLVAILDDIGNVECVASGAAALAKMEQDVPDLILLDVQMPDMDGYELCRCLKADPRTAEVPVIFLTASISADDEAHGLDLGAADYVRKPISARIVRRRVSNILELQAANRALQVMASTDPLTGAYNRRHFLDVCNTEMHRSQRYELPFSIAMLDIDNFKAVNDTYGHGIGDDALKATVRAINETLRDEDTLGRLGGEEFGVIFPQTTMDAGALVAERIRESVSEIVIATPEQPLSFTVSIGISDWRPDDSIDTVLMRADRALYTAKESGRNQVQQVPTE